MTKIALSTVLLLFATAAVGEETAPARAPEQVIQPEVERREVKTPHIDAQDIEIGVYTGTLSVEDFGAESVHGLRLAYHVTEDFFIEGTYARSTVSDAAFRRLGFVPIFRNEEEELTYYNLSVGFNLFPGEVFVGKGWAMTSAVYVIGGIGATSFNNTDNTTFNFGIGIRVLPFDWLALRVEMRDHLFESDILGKNKMTQNFELTLGVAAYF